MSKLEMMLNCSAQNRLALFLAGFVFAASQIALAVDGASYISTKNGKGCFTLSASGQSAPLYVSSQDYPGVIRIAKHLQADIGRVAKVEPEFSTDKIPTAKEVVLIGTLGRSPVIDKLVRSKKLDVRNIAGRWETFLLQVVEKPLPGVDRALVIAGSDKRGTIYGMYDLSTQIGVSPWYYWADIPVQRRSELYVLPGRHTQGEPAVKYRGIFINDENPALLGWVNETLGGFNHNFYEKVFELILRMKGNFLWPAMWGKAFYDDDSLNAPLADEYGVVISTSHHEPMMRAHVEWQRYGSGPWSYEKNEAKLREFWTEGIKRMKDYESVVTLAMRGDGDEPMSEEANIALLQRIVKNQREILGQVTHKEVTSIPQVWALYKEVQEYYDKGMRVPDDVTLLLCDDNWGNIRKLPKLNDKPRPGGYGVYYHYDYVGGPRNYKWLNTNQIQRVWEQMHLAYSYGARQIWIVNVGDLKPMEFPIEFFLDYAWNPEQWPAERLPEYTQLWAERQFGAEHAKDIANILTKYTQYNSRRKPELLSPDTYSLVAYREAETAVNDYNSLAERANKIYESIPLEYKDAFYQLVLHPVTACANLHELYVTVGRNRLYAKQGRAATSSLAQRAKELFKKDAEITHFYNTVMAAGKWNHMMDQTHIGYTYWQQPDSNAMPEVKEIEVPAAADLGVAIEGSENWWPMDKGEALLPEFDPFNQQTYFIEIFNRGQAPFDYVAQSEAPWLTITPKQGKVEAEQRVWVSVDWKQAPAGRQRVPITISGPSGSNVVVHALVFNPDTPKPDQVTGFVESNGYVAIEAEHYADAMGASPIAWLRIPDLGRTLSAMTPFPVTAESQSPGKGSPHLEYRMHLFSHGEVKVRTYLTPTLNFHNNQGLRYAISFDDEPPQIVNMHANKTFQDWEESVRSNITMGVSKHIVAEPGEHMLKFWMVDAGVVLQKLVVETGEVKPSYLGPPESYQNARTFTNPILAGFYPDPSICRAGNDYYLVTSSFSYFPGIPIFHSKDLVNWNQLGHVMDRPEQLNLDGLGVSRGIFAPAIRHNEGIFYVTCTLVDAGGNFVVTSSKPEGPWSNPVWIPEINGIDPSMFFDEDGKAYVVYNSIPPDDKPLYDGHRTIRIYEFDLDSLKVEGKEHILVNGGTDLSKKPVWIEAPHLFKVNGYYYLIAAEGGTGYDHSEVVFRTESVTGPYVPFEKNPILTQRHLDLKRKDPITSTGHADFVQTEAGDWWAVFLGCRPYDDDYYNTGRETFMAPVKWQDGWPVINPDHKEAQYVYPAPASPVKDNAKMPYSGNFRFKDEFDKDKLGHNWIFLRTPRVNWHSLSQRAGFLALSLRPETASGNANPSSLSHRQQHLSGAVTTSLEFSPKAENEKAGISVFQSEKHFYFLCKSLEAGEAVIQLYKASSQSDSGSSSMELLASEKLDSGHSEAKLLLRIEAHRDTYSFSYSWKPDQWILLKDKVDAKFLSTKVAGGFVGCVYALYATSLGKSSENVAHFDWFEYVGDDEVYK